MYLNFSSLVIENEISLITVTIFCTMISGLIKTVFLSCKYIQMK